MDLGNIEAGEAYSTVADSHRKETMSNINVGGVEGDLILNTREWIQPGKEALTSFRNVGSGITTVFDQIDKSSETVTRSLGGRLRDTRGRFVAFGTDTQQVADGVAQGFRRMGDGVTKGLSNIRSACQNVSQQLSSLSRVSRQVVGDLVGSFAIFDKGLRGTDAIAKLTAAGLQDLGKSVRDMGGEMKLAQGPNTLVDGLKQIAGAGYSAADSLKILRSAARGADAGETTTAVFAEGLTPTIKSYGLTADQSDLVTDQLFRAIDQGNLSAEDIAKQFGSVAPIAASAGVSLQELSGAFALMSTKGQSASENATQLRSAINHLQAPAVDAQKLLNKYGVEAGEAALRTKGLIGVLKDLFQKTGGNKIALKRILDDEGLQAAIKLIGADRGKSFQDAIAFQFSADGATQDAFDRQAKGLIFKVNQVKAAFENFKIGAGAGLEPFLTPLAEGLNRVTAYLVKLPDSTKAAIGAFAGLAAVGTTMLTGFTLLAPSLIQIGTWVSSFGGIAKVATTAVESLGAGFTGIRNVILTLNSPITSISSGFRVAASTLSAVAEGIIGIGAAIVEVVVPIVVIVGAVVAAVKGLRTAWDRDWGGIQEFTTEVMADVYNAISPVVDYMQSTVGPAVSQMATEIGQNFQAVWPDIKEFFGWLGREIFEIAIPALRSYWETTKVVWSGIAVVIRTAWGSIKPVLQYIGEDVLRVTEIFVTAVEGDWGRAMSLWWDYFKSIVPRIKSAFVEIVAAVKTGFLEMAQVIQDGLRKAFTWQETPKLDMDQLNLSAAQVKSGLNRLGLVDAFGSALDPLQGKLANASASLGGFVDTGKAKLNEFASSAKKDVLEVVKSFGLLDKKARPSSRTQIGGGLTGFVDPGEVPNIREPRGQRKKALSRSEMLSYISEHAGVEGDLRGLTDDTLKAAFRLVENSVAAKYKLILTSGFRPGSHGFHGSGQALDVVTADQPVHDWENRERPAMIQALASGTGFRSGLNEFRRDTASRTGATDAHVHLTTGLEAQPGQGGLPGAFLVKGGGSGGTGAVVAAIQKQLNEMEEAKKAVATYLVNANKKFLNEFDQKRVELKQQFDKAKSSADVIGNKDAERQITAAYKRQLAEVNETEKRETAKTVAEITILRLEAEGKLGEAARARIQETATEEKAALQQKLKLYPQMAEQIAAASRAIDESSTRQQLNLGLEQGGQRISDAAGLQSFQRTDPGMASLIQAFPQFRAEVEAAYAAVQRYIKDPSEATKAGLDAAQQSIQALAAQAEEAQQRKLQDVEFDLQLGQLTKDEAIARQGEILANWMGGEDSKRQALLQYSDIYREFLQQSLELQGEFNLETLEGLAESLSQAGQMTAQQQGQLIATNQLIQQQRLQDQQNWQGILQTSTGAFQGFLGNILTGQQSFSQSFTQLWKGIATQVIQELVKMIVKATILQKILSSVFGFFGGILGVGGGAGGLISGGGLSEFAGIGLGHSGGTVGHGWITPGRAPYFHSGGYVGGPLRSDETMAVLQTGEYVLSRQQLANMRASQGQAGARQVVVHAPISMQATINNEMDLDRVANYLGRQITLAVQGVA